MKFLSIVLAIIIYSGCGSTLNHQNQGAKENNVTAQTTNETLTTNTEMKSDSTAANPAPTKRTVDMKGSLPWEYYGYQEIEKLVDNGKVVYLWNDAAKLEDHTKFIINWIPKKTKAENAKSPEARKKGAETAWNGYIKAFIYEMQKENIGHQQYLDQLSKVGELMSQQNNDAAMTALNKAISIRTGQ